MSDLADLIRSKAPDLSNRQIAERAGLRPGTVDRVMNGVGQPKVETVDKIAQALKIPVEQAREAAGKPRGSSELYVPPAEARLLDERQRLALDELIRSVTSVARGSSDRSLFLAKLAHMDSDGWSHLMYRARLAFNTNNAEALHDLVAEVESEVLDEGWSRPSGGPATGADIAWLNDQRGPTVHDELDPSLPNEPELHAARGLSGMSDGERRRLPGKDAGEENQDPGDDWDGA